MQCDLPSFTHAIEHLIAQQQWEAAIRAISALTDSIDQDPAAMGSVFSSPTLDALCQRIGARSLALLQQQEISATPTAKPPEVIILATELHNIGGHSRVVEDIIRAQPDKHHLVLMTDFLSNPSPQHFATQRYTALGAELRIAPKAKRFDKLLWTQQQLLAHPHAQVLLFNHHADVVAIAAVQPGINRELLFCHHADHQLCLGAHLTYGRHIDFFEEFYHRCHHKGLAAELWSLAVPDRGARPHTPESFRSNNKLITCSSGHTGKYTSRYPIQYGDVLLTLFSTTEGQHIHIGQLPQDILDGIRHLMEKHHIAPERFQHIEWVESVGETLLAQQVDLYIGSVPLGGGRATIEAIGAGVPIITHKHTLLPMLGTAGLGPKNTWCWETLAELEQILRNATPSELAQRSRQAREHYLTQHSIASFNTAVCGETVVHPRSYALHATDELASYLLRAQLRAENFSPVFDTLQQALTAEERLASGAPISLLDTGTALLDADRFDEAHTVLLQALNDKPDDPDILFQLGRLALAMNMPEDAYHILQAAAQRSTATLQKLIHFGQQLVNEGQSNQAKIILNLIKTIMHPATPTTPINTH